MKTYKQETKPVEITLELKNGTQKRLVAVVNTAAQLQDYLNDCSARDAATKGKEGTEFLVSRIEVQSKDLAALFGVEPTLFTENLDSATMGEILRDVMGELLTGKGS